MSTLGLLNMVFIQWLGIRLARVYRKKDVRPIGWSVIYNVRPMTGWSTPYQPLIPFLPNNWEPGEMS